MRLLFFSMVWLAIAGSAALARPVRPSDIGSICAVDIDRFCPALSPATIPRDLLICLRPYHYSLALACRRALAAKS